MMDWRTIYVGMSGANRLLRSILTVLGVLLLSFGVLILVLPWLLQFLVGSLFILLGAGLLAAAWRRRGSWRPPPPRDDGPDVIDDWR